jgi:hypothetical protein
MMVRIAQLRSHRLRRAEGGTLLSEEIALIFLSIAQAKAMPFAQRVDDCALPTTSDCFRRPSVHH